MAGSGWRAATRFLPEFNTYQGGTVIDAGATLALGFGDTAGAIIGDVIDNGTFTFNRSNAFTLSGPISGSGGVSQVGSGTTTLSAANVFTGRTAVSKGTLALSGQGSIASSNAVNLSAGTTFDISGTTAGTSITTLDGAAGATVALGTQPLTITRGSTTFAGNIQGSGGLSVSGGTQTLAGENSYSGATTVSGGKLALSGSGSIAGSNRLTLNNPGTTFDISETTAGTSITTLNGAAGSTVALGAQTLTLTNASNTFQGAIQGSGGLTLSGGSERLSGANSYTGATTIDNGTLDLLQTGSIASSSEVDLPNSNATFDISRATAKAAITSLAGIAGSSVDLGTQTLAITNGSTGFAGVIDGLGGLEVSGGTQTLAGVNRYLGATTVSGGTLVLAGTGAIAGSSEVDLGGSGATFDIARTANGASIQTLDGVGGTTVSLGSETLTIANASTTFGGAIQGPGGRLAIARGTQVLTGVSTYGGGTSIATGATLQLGNGGAGGSIAGDVTDNGMLISDRSDSAQLSDVISGSGSLKKIGSGDLLLAGSNTYAGGSSLGTGSLSLGSNTALGSGQLTMQAGTTLDAAAPGLAVANSISLAGDVVFDSGANLWQLAGNIGGPGGFTKEGTGSLSLTGRESYRGATTISNGTLVGAGPDFGFARGSAFTLQSAGRLSVESSEEIGSLAGSGEVNIAGDTELIHGGNDQSTIFSGLLSGTGSFDKTGAGTFTFSGDGSGFTGQTDVEDGTLLVDGSLSSAAVSVSAGALGGNGRIAGAVSVGAASLQGLQGRTLTMGSLKLSSSAHADVTLGAPGTMPLFDVLGNLKLDGTLNVTDAGGFGAGVYRLINYGGVFTNSGMVIGTAPDQGELAVQTAVPNQVNLVNRAGQNLTFWDGGNPIDWSNGRVDGGTGTWDLTTEAWTGQDGAVDGPMTPHPAPLRYSRARRDRSPSATGMATSA